MSLPYKIATLLYCFNQADEVLLMHRSRQPNLGLWSPPGGKLDVASGEAPHVCAAREAEEELCLRCAPSDFHLTGIVSEHGYQGQAHWLMFLFELRLRLDKLPPPHSEGNFAFVSRARLATLPLPSTDLETIWPLFWRWRGGFFAAHCHTASGKENYWTVYETAPPNSHGRN